MAQQLTLFGSEPDPWEEDDRELACIAEVVFAEAPYGPYDYRVPEILEGRVQAGVRVRVPLGRGNRRVIGYCRQVTTRNRPARKLKYVTAVLDERPLLSEDLLRLGSWLAEYYLCPLGQVLETLVPAGVRAAAGTRKRTFLHVPASVLADLSSKDLKLPPKQEAVLRWLAEQPNALTTPEIREACGCSVAPIQGLLKRGLLEATERRVSVFVPKARDSREVVAPPLNPAQQQAVEAIVGAIGEQQPTTFLLHGVTGSGKTEVYIRVIDEVVRYGRQAIVLVPEISLTPQTWERFRDRFDSVAVLHSQLTPQERNWHWQQIAAGKVNVVVGARSAIFAPVPQLGLIVIDEEHDGSFKQDKAPRYHARTVAHWRAQQAGIPLILGSATPSLETWMAAEAKRITRLSLPERVAGRALPDVKIVDLRYEKRRGGALSRPLVAEIRLALQNREQVILLLNRRGFSTHIQCPRCGHVVACPHCAIPLTHHHRANTVECHYCDHDERAPVSCPECGSGEIRYSGTGTERLEAQLRSLFPDASALRMDGDTMKRPGSHEEALERFRRHEVDILLGTQMIAKGLDFPNVTVVGVINADTGLHFPDFRAAERTFQLVTQVAGRTGRGDRAGRVVIQTFTPDHRAIDAAARHQYERFVAEEWQVRKRFSYPPATRLIRLLVRGSQEQETERAAQEVATTLQAAAGDLSQVRVTAAAAAPFAKLRGKFRFHVLLFGPQLAPLRGLIERVQPRWTFPGDVHLAFDVEPTDLL